MRNRKWTACANQGREVKGMRGHLFFFLIAYFFFFPASVPASDVTASLNKQIKAIEVRGLSRISEEEMIDLICFDIGNMFDKSILQSGVRRAFKKGVFLDIIVVSEPFEDGIKLIYTAEEIPVIKRITVKGNKKISSRRIKKIFPYKEDENFREDLMEQARAALVKFYKGKGFPDAAIAIEVKKTEKQPLVTLNLAIDEGPPLIVKSVEVPDTVRKYLHVLPGDRFDAEKLDKDIDKIREYYKKEKYINPVVGPYVLKNDNLIIPVKTGKVLELKFRGNSAVRKKELIKQTSLLYEEGVSDDSIEESVRRITQLYHTKGYYYAQVAGALESDDDKMRVSFFIVEGKKVVLKKMLFSGNSISEEAIRKIIPFKENKAYNENLLNGSRESLISFYNALGYLRMEVQEVKKTFNSEGNELALEFLISEGTQTKIEEIIITGNREISISRIKRTLQLSEGSPYNVIDIGDARYRILSLYGRKGYVNAHVDVESKIEGSRAVLLFTIVENSPSVIGKIILKGNRKTKSKIVWREFTIDEGEPYNYEELLKTKQGLYKLGLFNEVSIDTLDSGKNGEGKLVKDVIISMKEGKAGSVEFGLGYGDYEKLRGSFDIRYDNLGGYDRRVGFKTEMSTVEKRYVFSFREPWLFNEPNIPFNVYLMKEDKEAVNLDTKEVLYKIDRLSLVAGIEKKLTERLRVNLNYEYSFTDTTEVQPDVALNREDVGTIGIGSISPSIFYDTRDDPFNPTTGSLNGIVLKFASQAFLSETEFIKGSFQSAWFFKLRKGLVLALSFRGGAAYSFDDNKELPLIERFFLGGRTTVRGYSQDTLGPKGADDNPTGGNIYSLVNSEFRIALGKGFSLVPFMDMGNVWKVIEDVETEQKYTVGAGLRYGTPVGPIRVDYGHKLDREEGESAGELHFSFGHAF